MRIWSFLIFSISWMLLSWFAPSSTYWRDSSEFIISATFLDVAHPAGFPLYSQLAHLFSHIPFGPLAWRVNLFSTFLGSLSLVLTFLICANLLRFETKLPGKSFFLISLVPCLILLLSESFLKQAFLPEAYLLNAVLIQILFLLIYAWYRSGDNRYFFTASFIAGASLGNHISIALTYFFMLIPLLFNQHKILNLLTKGVILFLFGLSIYLYIPIRAHSDLILNTGQAVTLDRLFNLLTNQRDWLIRSAQVEGVKEAATLNFHLLNGNFIEMIKHDAPMLAKELSPLIFLLSIIGIVIGIVKKRYFVTTSLLAIGISNWLFFAGWNADPWIPLIIVILILSTITFAEAFILLSRVTQSKNLAPIGAAMLGSILILGSINQEVGKQLKTIKNYEMARYDAKVMIRNSPDNTNMLIEPSLFSLQYITSLEGYRDDINLIYLLDLYFPELFNLKTYNFDKGTSFTPKTEAHPHPPNIDNVSNFIMAASSSNPIEMEAVTVLNQHLREVINLTPDGRLALIQGKNRDVADQFFLTILQEIEVLISHFYEMPKIISADVASRIEIRAMMFADLFYQLGMPLRAAQILKLLCDQPARALCFKPVEQNLKAYTTLLYDKGNKENVSH